MRKFHADRLVALVEGREQGDVTEGLEDLPPLAAASVGSYIGAVMPEPAQSRHRPTIVPGT